MSGSGLCYNFLRGHCAFGSRCRFAHAHQPHVPHPAPQQQYYQHGYAQALHFHAGVATAAAVGTAFYGTAAGPGGGHWASSPPAPSPTHFPRTWLRAPDNGHGAGWKFRMM